MYRVTIYFKDGSRKIKEHIVHHDNACRVADNAWDDYDGVIKTSLEEEK